jgi:hypothetical protein
MDYYILILILAMLLTFYINVFVITKECPKSQVIYKYIPEHILTKQFSQENNNVGAIYTTMFNKNQPTIGGFEVGYEPVNLTSSSKY